jgi:hypothetical protein
MTPFLVPCLMASLTGGCALRAAPTTDPATPDRMRAALRSGVRPIQEAIADAERRYVGEVTEVELEVFGPQDRWVHEVTFLPPHGEPFEVKLDARTGALVEAEGPVQLRSAESAEGVPGGARR